MSWNREFLSQAYGTPVYKHSDLPVFITDEFSFYRCVEFHEDFYDKNVSCLFNGNLRTCTGRYSSLFPGQRLSYWADSAATARAEIKKHGSGNSILTFWAYDDGSSTFPTLKEQEPLVIIDGRECGIQALIDKMDNQQELLDSERNLIKRVMEQEPDCLAFDSHARKGGENFIFFEKGFKKLSLRQVRICFGRKEGGAHNCIRCADSCDYKPNIESYGKFFKPKAKVKWDESYLKTEEYLLRRKMYEKSLQIVQGR